MKRFFLTFTVILLVLLMQVNGEDKEAANLTPVCKITVSDNQSAAKITDGSQDTYFTYTKGTRIDVECEKDIYGVYIIWDKSTPDWKLETSKGTKDYGVSKFLHEFVSVEKERDVSILLENGARICEIYLFGEGKLPSWVQVWKAPHERADLMLMPTHSDDEHLFFAGILPYYTTARELKVQVVYMTHHNASQSRPHELLNGLWRVGVRNYPVISEFPDLSASAGSTSEEIETVFNRALTVYNKDELIEYQVEMIRRFKPLVIVGHDINGEYRHGAHMLNAYTLMQALEISNDPEKFPDSYNMYGGWDVPKTYLHLWQERKIVMNWDIPLEKLGGKTAFEVSKEGYSEHLSQQWTWFTKWLAGEGVNKASDIKTYSPCEFGLYRTTVGEDVIGNDFFENITPYVDETPVPETPEPTPAPTDTPVISETPVVTQNPATPTVPPEDIDDPDYRTLAVIISAAVVVVVFGVYLVIRRVIK